jgi:CTP synthase (UTP-ammonia lyase)
MRSELRIGLIGDRDVTVKAHQAIPRALELAERALTVPIIAEWIPTVQIRDRSRVEALDGIWTVPASPYRSMDGALQAIRYAREHECPFLGTCGGFQHAIVEYARNVLGWDDADHAETAPDAHRTVIAPLACALVEVTDTVRLSPGSRIAQAYACDEVSESYRCRYGLSPDFRAALTSGSLRVSAVDSTDEVRAVELEKHPFFVATLFQPERSALEGRLPPLVRAFVQAAVRRREGTRH